VGGAGAVDQAAANQAAVATVGQAAAVDQVTITRDCRRSSLRRTRRLDDASHRFVHQGHSEVPRDDDDDDDDDAEAT
jgi:hypothetical protein